MNLTLNMAILKMMKIEVMKLNEIPIEEIKILLGIRWTLCGMMLLD